MDKKQVSQNESIKDGLEKFLDQQMFGLSDIPKKTVQTEFADTAPMDVKKQVNDMLSDLQSREYSEGGRKRMDGTNRSLQHHDASQSGTRTGSTHRSGNSDTEYDRGRGTSARRNRNEEYEPVRRKKTEKRNAPQSQQNRTEKNRLDQNRKSEKNKKRNPKNGKGRKPMKKWKKVLLILLIVVLALFIWWYIMVANVYKKMTYEKSDDIIEGSMKEDGVINVLLIGNDSRENDGDGRSDAMILVSISEKTKKIYMTSLLRDMYVEIPGHDANRLNAAYSYGGPALLCETIEQNFDIEINRYAIVNFQAFASLVDAVGGVDLELTNEEVQWVNAYLNEYNLLENREITTDYLDTSLSGELHLNGPQALAYCRNRYIGTDFGRTQRQRNVLSAIMKKLPLALATNSSEVISGLCSNLTTNMKQSEVYSLSLNAAKYLTYETEQMVIPADGTYSNATIRKMMVLQVDFEANKKIIKEKIYGEVQNEEF